jgi:CYTH domain-containing protein
VHRARIAGKRLRYLLEPIEALVPEGKECIAQLKALQDLLGDHHDTHVWLLALAEAAPRAPRAALRSGLGTITSHVRQRSDERFVALSERWLGGEPPLFATVGRLAASLAASAVEGIEIERKYLLSALPKRMPKRRLERIAQGYLPGERLIERVRRVRAGEETRYYRTVKGGSGLARIEIEEECSAATFAALWRLTKGRRVLKRRHLVTHEGREWAVDEFTDREEQLVLAEVELPTIDAEVVLPPWLAPLVVREVTGEPAYVNAVLAK